MTGLQVSRGVGLPGKEVVFTGVDEVAWGKEFLVVRILSAKNSEKMFGSLTGSQMEDRGDDLVPSLKTLSAIGTLISSSSRFGLSENTIEMAKHCEMGSESQNRLPEQPNKFERVHASPCAPFSCNQNVTTILLQKSVHVNIFARGASAI